ncbi:hypothetical protein J6590_096024 [Homalodisca vitripennis]|nr:hypothetical protein J6590_096024 [Homalodisca vitripennis]
MAIHAITQGLCRTPNPPKPKFSHCVDRYYVSCELIAQLLTDLHKTRKTSILYVKRCKASANKCQVEEVNDVSKVVLLLHALSAADSCLFSNWTVVYAYLPSQTASDSDVHIQCLLQVVKFPWYSSSS